MLWMCFYDLCRGQCSSDTSIAVGYSHSGGGGVEENGSYADEDLHDQVAAPIFTRRQYLCDPSDHRLLATVSQRIASYAYDVHCLGAFPGCQHHHHWTESSVHCRRALVASALRMLWAPTNSHPWMT